MSFVIGPLSFVIGDKLKGRAFCQPPYIEFDHSPKHAYMESPKEKRKMAIPLPHFLISPSPHFPISPSPHLERPVRPVRPVHPVRLLTTTLLP
ncbi:MAG: hypothetical protein F6K31_34090 [Symploca sp. SIO2G7]|nr:hypothetical protein [Symploca sp. SIO2G7]